MNYKPVVLIILDGFGYRESKVGNAIAQASTPFIDKLWRDYPHALLEASGAAMGLPDGQIGSSEVGHMTIGAGAILDQDLVTISKAVKNGQLVTNPVFISAAEHVKKNNSILHLAGLVSPGGVHSHQDHLHAIISAFKQLGVNNIAIHAFTDGRDTHFQSSQEYLKNLEDYLEGEGVGIVASIQGRYFAMDRDNNWDRIKKAEDAIFHCQGNICQFKKPSEVVKELHAQGHGDEHLEPHIFADSEGRMINIGENDAVFFFNFRPDRMRQIVSRVLTRASSPLPAFFSPLPPQAGEGRERVRYNIFVATLTQYDPTFKANVAFPPKHVETTLAEQIAKAGLRQVHIAETDKYAHITYFLNGGKEKKHSGEEWVMVDSRKDIPTHDLAPEMRAKEITDQALSLLPLSRPQRERGWGEGEIHEMSNSSIPDFIAINYANADIVGHTGNLSATVRAIEVLDKELERLVTTVQSKGGIVLITADHGNAEQLSHDSGDKHTAHTNNLVPVFLARVIPDSIGNPVTLRNGNLADVAPTVLELLGVKKPAAMTGNSLY